MQLVPSGGAVLEALAREGDETRFKFTPPLQQRPTADFSFSGLKTAIRMTIEAELPWLVTDPLPVQPGSPHALLLEKIDRSNLVPPAEEEQRRRKADIAASFQVREELSEF